MQKWGGVVIETGVAQPPGRRAVDQFSDASISSPRRIGDATDTPWLQEPASPCR